MSTDSIYIILCNCHITSTIFRQFSYRHVILVYFYILVHITKHWHSACIQYLGAESLLLTRILNIYMRGAVQSRNN